MADGFGAEVIRMNGADELSTEACGVAHATNIAVNMAAGREQRNNFMPIFMVVFATWHLPAML